MMKIFLMIYLILIWTLIFLSIRKKLKIDFILGYDLQYKKHLDHHCYSFIRNRKILTFDLVNETEEGLRIYGYQVLNIANKRLNELY